MKIHITQTIDANVDHVWKVFGTEFADIQAWSDFVQSSRPNTDGPAIGDAGINGRLCETKLGPLIETLDLFRNDARELRFVVKGRDFPFFMRSITSHWRFSPENGRTRAQTEVTLDLVFPSNIVMGWVLKRNFRKILNDVGGELAAYIKAQGMA